MERADIAIIGTGPGGVSAALTAKVRNKKYFADREKADERQGQQGASDHELSGTPGGDRSGYGEGV